jgi:MFS family permease
MHLRSFRLLQFLAVLAAEIVPLATTRAALGVLQGGLTPISAKILKDWIPLQHRGKSSACIGACMSVGGALTLWLTGWLLDAGFGWRGIFHAYSLVEIVWGIGFFWYFRTRPQQHRDLNAAEAALILGTDQPTNDAPSEIQSASHTPSDEPTEPSVGSSARDAFAMATSTSMWAFCIQSFFRAAGYAFFVTWFFNFLESKKVRNIYFPELA